jgi:hypothetical protein
LATEIIWMENCIYRQSEFTFFMFNSLANRSLNSSNIALKLSSQQNAVIIPWESISVQAITQNPRRVYFNVDVQINLFRDEPPVQANHQNGGEHVDEPMNGQENHEAPQANGDGEDCDEGNETDDSEEKMTEFWMLPEKPEDVDEIYSLMTKYPVNTGQNSGDSDEEEEEEFFDGDDMANIHIEGTLYIQSIPGKLSNPSIFQITINSPML